MAWNRPTEETGNREQGRGEQRNVHLKGLVAGAIVVFGAVVAAWWLWPTRESASEASQPRTRQRIKEVTPAAAPTNKVEVAKPKPKDPHEGMVRASNGVWHPKGRPYRFDWTAPHSVVTNSYFAKLAGQSAAQTGTEEILENIFMCERGDMPRPLPLALPEEDIRNMANILISRDEITDKDSEELAVSKDLLNKVKDELQKYIKSGGEVEDFILDYQEELERTFIKRNDAQLYLHEMVENGESPDIIKAMTEKINGDFEKEGIKPVADPIALMENSRIANEQLKQK